MTRQGQLRVDQPLLVLEIKDLPATLQPDSIQAYPSGTAVVTLQEPEIQTVMEPAELQGEAGTLSEQVHTLEGAFRACKDQITALTLQRTFLETLLEKAADSFATGLSQRTMALEDVANMLHFLEKSYLDISSAIAQHERRKHELDHQLQETRQKLQDSHAPDLLARYRLLLPIQVEKAGLLTLSILYDVEQANWAPIYEVRLNEALQDVQIDYVAQVHQNTGEPWPHVDLKFSTATHLKEPTLPKVGVWHVNLSNTKIVMPERGDTSHRRPRSSSILEDTYRMLGAVPGSEIPIDDVDENTRLFQTYAQNAVVCFTASEAALVASGDRPQRVKLCQLHIDSQLSYMALPQLCSAPYLQAQLANPLETWPLLAGTAHIYKEGGYIGREPIEYVAPGDSFQLSLGMDERISLRRELIHKDTQGTHDCRDSRTYRLTLHNPFDHIIHLTVVEQIPMSQTDKIQVNLVEATPATTASGAGLCQWAIALQPHETQHITYKYVVSHPCDMPVLGWDS